MDILLLFIQVLAFVVSTTQICNKFAGRDGFEMAVTLNDVCFYLNNYPDSYTKAKTTCESVGTRLALLDTETKQTMINGMIGFFAPTYWIGLQKIDDTWYWIDGNNKYPMSNPRWSLMQTDDGATVASARGSTWDMQTTADQHRYVCEDAHTPPTEPTTTVTKNTAMCHKVDVISGVTFITYFSSPSVIDCATECLKNSECTFCQFNTRQCRLISDGGTTTTRDGGYRCQRQ